MVNANCDHVPDSKRQRSSSPPSSLVEHPSSLEKKQYSVSEQENVTHRDYLDSDDRANIRTTSLSSPTMKLTG